MTSEHHGHSARRKSFGFFSRPTILGDNETVHWISRDPNPPPPRPKSLFGVSGLHEISPVVSNGAPVPRSPKVLTKGPTARPRSVFGSLKSRESQPSSPVIASSGSSSIGSTISDPPVTTATVSSTLIFSGELVTGGGLLRKKREYVVLTSRELLRYKSEQKFTEAFGGVRTRGRRSSSVASFGEITGDHALILRLEQAVAVYHTGPEAEAGCGIQIDYIDLAGSPCSVVLQAATPAVAQQWVDHIRNVALWSRMDATSYVAAISEMEWEYVVRRVEAERDYSPDRFQIFLVAQRAGKSGSKTGSLEDLQKMYSTVCYLAIGLHKVHLVPIRGTTNKSTTALQMPVSSHAILNLTYLSISEFDDSFSLAFRMPCQPATKLALASADSKHIVQSIRQLHDHLLPLWHKTPFILDIPNCMKLADEPLPEIPPTPGDDLQAFDRTLAAFCTAYELDASNIVYSVIPDVEDGPQFVLYPPQHRRSQYTDLELLAILRTLRWNETFGSLCFRGIPLDALNKAFDDCGTEYEPRWDRATGRPISLKTSGGGGKRSLLVHELRAVALYSGKLRRVDFSECFKPRSRGSLSGDEFSTEKCTEKACPVLEAIMPLCKRGLTNLDWFILTGVELLEPDLDWLVDAAASRLAHFRGFELSRCGLTERMINLFLNALAIHETTIEALDFSGNQARLYAPTLNDAMCYFPFIRKLNVSRIVRAAANEAALTTETLFRWRLEDLDLSETKLNPESVDALAAYLSSEKSSALRHLVLTQCSLTAKDVAVLMRAMVRTPGTPRKLHLHIGQNPLAQGKDLTPLLDCITSNITPTHLTMRMVDYPLEDLFQSLLRALTTNTTITYLDLSKTSLPFEANDQTCLELGRMFALNNTLTEIDLSGEQAVLENTSLGKGLCSALSRLAENHTLEILRIERQALSTQGAMELASIIAKNHTLREIHCDQNEFHLQGFTAMVNALQGNYTLTFLSSMDQDRSEHVRLLKEKLFQSGALKPITSVSSTTHHQKEKDKEGKEKKSSLKRSHLHHHHSKKFDKKVAFSSSSSSSSSAGGGNDLGRGGLGGKGVGGQGVEHSLQLLEEKWASERERLVALLARNACEGMALGGGVGGAGIGEKRRGAGGMGRWVLPELTF
ncbi:RNI-like protein [Ascodesmis nigricans]|uniref:RNI-like protein n=1 Tax=Ascodesmis nigricans TaxID=341454 RepID=A0A4S2MWF9_9PEZI|nr:RNI-like protein [Ascodesmis nigricans]